MEIRLRAIGLFAFALLTIHLTGCIVPSVHRAERAESACGPLSKGVPSFIKIGATTRQQILDEMGVALGIAPDDSWLTYGCRISQGGVKWWLFAPNGGDELFETEEFIYERLVVRFDPAGTVARADFEEKSCRMRRFARPGRDTAPCLDLSGGDLLELTTLPFLSGEGAFILYEPIQWYELWAKHHDRATADGILIVGDRSLMVRSGCDLRLRTPCDLRQATTEITKLAYSEISAVEYTRYALVHPVVLITPKQGDMHALTVYRTGGELADGTKTKAAAELIRARVEAANHQPR